jgi:hypothetical protein
MTILRARRRVRWSGGIGDLHRNEHRLDRLLPSNETERAPRSHSAAPPQKASPPPAMARLLSPGRGRRVQVTAGAPARKNSTLAARRMLRSNEP